MGHFTEAVGYPVITCITGYTLLALAAFLYGYSYLYHAVDIARYIPIPISNLIESLPSGHRGVKYRCLAQFLLLILEVKRFLLY